MFLDPVTNDEIIKLIISLKTSNAEGWDGIAVNSVKKSYHNCIDILTHVIHLSFSKGVFPSDMKTAKVIPLYKNDHNMVVNNYYFAVFSKLLERLMYNRLISFINKHKLLNKFQFGFRSKHSTKVALIYLIDNISKAINEKEIVIGVFLDFSKACDTINHNILFSKLNHYGIRGVALDWLMELLYI